MLTSSPSPDEPVRQTGQVGNAGHSAVGFSSPPSSVFHEATVSTTDAPPASTDAQDTGTSSALPSTLARNTPAFTRASELPRQQQWQQQRPPIGVRAPVRWAAPTPPATAGGHTLSDETVGTAASKNHLRTDAPLYLSSGRQSATLGTMNHSSSSVEKVQKMSTSGAGASETPKCGTAGARVGEPVDGVTPSSSFSRNRQPSRVAAEVLEMSSRSKDKPSACSARGRTFFDERGVLHSEYREDPVDVSVQRALKQESRKNIIFVIGLVLLSLVLTVAGGVGVGCVNMHYSVQLHREDTIVGNRAILNSSVLILQTYTMVLQLAAQNLMNFASAAVRDHTYDNVTEMRDALRMPFFAAWVTWLYSSNVTATHSIFVPFCVDTEINSDSCPIMTLGISCMPGSDEKLCTYRTSTDDGLGVEVYAIDMTHEEPRIGAFKGYSNISVHYRSYDTSPRHGHYLPPGYDSTGGNAEHTLLTMRRQENVTLNGGGATILICEAGSLLSQWFKGYEASLQKADKSISMLFRDNGTILAYGYGGREWPNNTASVPCHYFPPSKQPPGCGKSAAGVLDAMVNVFRKSVMDSNILNAIVTANGDYSRVVFMGDYIVAYQDFLRFKADWHEDNIVFFAAYATPVSSKLGRDGVLQIVVCVIIVFLCMFILGGVAVVATTQMMRMVEVISQLATHAAMYDTKQMRAVLDRQHPSYLARLITSTAVINHEFQRILENLNAYRPFLPQSLLTNGSFYFSEDGKEQQLAVHRRAGDFVADTSRPDCEQEMALYSPVMPTDSVTPASHDEAHHLFTNPLENRRLLQRGFHRTKSTILVAALCNVSLNAGDSVDVVNKFSETVLHHAHYANGVVEAIEYEKVIVSFNSHFPVPRHQEKACLCALAMRDAFRDSGCSVCIGISSGYNYVGTTGTEYQKARVIMGESVVVAQALTTLQHYLGCSVFANEDVMHDALVTSVVVDVVQLYYDHTHEWKQYHVSEIVGHRATPLSTDMQLVRSVFKLVRCRQAEAALVAVEAYLKELEDREEAVPWSVRRLRALVQTQQQLIQSGYHRQRRNWQTLEGDDVIVHHLREANDAYTTHQRHLKTLQSSNNTAGWSSSCADTNGNGTNGVAGSADMGLVATDSITRRDQHHDEARMARALLDEQSKASTSKRLVVPAQCPMHAAEDTMFAIFVPNHDDDETEEASDCDREHGGDGGNVTSTVPAAAAGVSASTLRATRASRVHLDVDVRGEFPLSCLPDDPQLLATSGRGAAAASHPVVSSNAVFAGQEPTISVFGPTSDPSLRGPLSASNRNRAFLMNSTHSAAHTRDDELNARTSDSAEDGPLVSAHKSSGGNNNDINSVSSACKNSGGSATYNNGCDLPRRIVSVEGQVFRRTSQQVGRGSFGAVYLVISETGYLGAMKSFPLNQSNAAHLIREVETLSQMRHDNIVGYDCCAIQDDYFFIICEYMSAGTLGKLIQSLGCIPERASRKYARDVLFGLGYLHQHSWVHCDIKPDNILMSSDGTCKLADFGAAVLSRSFADTTAMRGTVRFSAPEALLGVCGKAGDVYSFGMTLAQMLTGVHPWHAYVESDAFFLVRYVGEIRHAMETGESCAMQPDLPSNLDDTELEAAIRQCCEFDPKKRPTVEELLTLLS